MMSPILYSILITIVAGLLVGCTGTDYTKVAPSGPVGSQDGFGYVLGSIEREIVESDSWGIVEKTAFNRYTVYFRKPNGEYAGHFSLSKSPEVPNDFEEGNSFFFELPVGEYEVYTYLFYELHIWPRQGSTSYEPSSPFIYKFTVDEGSVTYLGTFFAKHLFYETKFGKNLLSGGTFTVIDNLERDIAFAEEKYDIDIPQVNPDLSDFRSMDGLFLNYAGLTEKEILNLGDLNTQSFQSH